MSSEILVNSGLGETRIAIVEDGVLREVTIERPHRRSVVGAIFLGRVASVVPAMNAAFVEIGLERAGFLGAYEARPPETPLDRGSAPPPISASVHEGEAVLVQAVKDPLADKGARLSRQLSLAGRYLVYAPYGSGVAISRRIVEEEARAQLTTLVAEAADEKGAQGGFIVRTAAADAAPEDLVADIRDLGALWAEIGETRANADAPACLFNDLGPVERSLRDHVQPGTERIVVDDAAAFRAAKSYCARHLPEFEERIEQHSGGNLFDLHAIEDDIAAAREPRVDLPAGGHIVIESTEALTAIDVNSGRASSADNHGETILTTNLEAAREVARQLRLRSIGGLIVVDFIHMSDVADGEQVLEELRRSVAADRAPMQIGGFSEFGLVEITRKRTRDPLPTLLSEDCTICGGAGRMPTSETVAYEILRQAEQEARAGLAPDDGNDRLVQIYAAPEVAAFLNDDAGNLVDALEDRLGVGIEVSPDSSLARDQYEIDARV